MHFYRNTAHNKGTHICYYIFVLKFCHHPNKIKAMLGDISHCLIHTQSLTQFSEFKKWKINGLNENFAGWTWIRKFW